LAADDKGTLDDGVVGLTEDGTSTEDVLTTALETREEAADLVVAHEGEGELLVVLVVEPPDRELVELAVLPEPGKGDLTGLLVGVLALPIDLLVGPIVHFLLIRLNIPVVEDECGLAKELKRVLWLGSLGSFILLLLSLSSSLDLRLLLGLGLRSSLRLLLLLLLLVLVLRAGRRFVLESLLGEDSVLDNSLVDVLANDSVEPTGDVGVVGAPLGVPEKLETAGDNAGSEEVGKGEALGNEVGVHEEVVLKDLDAGLSCFKVVVDALLVIGVTADQGTE
jgi:hypothetical protein